jgi:isopropylmalate/homocitrate/citramalate synthase
VVVVVDSSSSSDICEVYNYENNNYIHASKGLSAALSLGVQEVAVFGAASESFSQKNINCSIEESIERFRPVCQEAIKNGLRVRG